jgi:hypothetical protein
MIYVLGSCTCNHEAQCFTAKPPPKKTFKRRSQAQAAPQNEACLHGQNVHGRQPRAQLGNLFVKQPMIVFHLPHQIMCSSSRCGKRSQSTACSHGATLASLITIFITSHEVPLGVHAPYLTPHDSRTKAALTKEFFFSRTRCISVSGNLTKSFKVPLALVLCVRKALPLAVLSLYHFRG